MDATALSCRVEDRRKKLFNNPDWNGIDFLEVADDQLSLCVHFFGQVPKNVGVVNVRIEGGRRIRDIRAVKVDIDSAHDPELDDCLRITLDKFGDFSTYRLCLVEPVGDADKPYSRGARQGDEAAWRPMSGLDPRYSCLAFTFKVDCPSDLDCKPADDCPPEVFPAPEINYLAKDYASFRQLILDRLALTMPDWRERHVPDLGITLVELLAYVGDHLSYYQDAVATEAYLDTARKRISVRRHARLVDYRMHEGCNARAWVTVHTANDLPEIKAKDFYFITGFADIKASSGNVVKAEDLEQVPPHWYDVFEPLTADPDLVLRFRAAHSTIHFYTWGDKECCLPKGATRATLLDEPVALPAPAPAAAAAYKPPPRDQNYDKPYPQEPQRPLALSVGDVLIFEELIGPTTGNPADADPARRHAVRLTKVSRNVDELLDKHVLDVEWAPEDALPFSLCLSARLPAPDCSWIDHVSVARGNVVLVDHGRTVGEPLGPVEGTEVVGECACEGSVIDRTTVAKTFAPNLTRGPLTFGEDLPPELPPAPALRLISQDPRQAKPRVSLWEFIGGADTAAGAQWHARYDLLGSDGDDRHFVAEIDDEGGAHLRFGDDDLGEQPATGTRFHAAYRVGNGPAGNVGRETISHLVLRNEAWSGVTVTPRNPLPAHGGTPPEPIATVKLLAPTSFRAVRERAITAEDYAELARRNPALQGAAAELRWTGSWYEARVAVDAAHSVDADAALLAAIDRYLLRYRRIGHDVAVAPAQYVPLDVAMDVCVLPHHTRGQVTAELRNVFSNRRLADGKLGFFHPDRLTFGAGIHLSQIVAAAKAVEGVETVEITRCNRLHEPDSGATTSGVLRLGPFEVARCDSDPSFPEHGKFDFNVRGGR
jgi:hypothetical protein